VTDDYTFSEQPLGELLARIATGPAPPGAGTVAALTAAMAAGLVAMAARSIDAIGSAAQAEVLGDHLVELAEEDARALAHALASLAGAAAPDSSPEARDFLLGRALVRAADELVQIGEASESVAELAAAVAADAVGPMQADAAGAATIAESAARVVAALVETNLATLEGDTRLERARRAAAGAAAASARAARP
jgi:formiminotetrahydrofolate cyclodeaminase